MDGTSFRRIDHKIKERDQILLDQDQAISESEDRNKVLISVVPDLICIISREGLILDIHDQNKTAVNTSDLQEFELIPALAKRSKPAKPD